MSDWSVQRVEQLAPDAAAVKAAQGLAKPDKWLAVARHEHLIWGACQGSGANPYQVRVDLLDVAYKCSCLSRKQPCKHTLGLLLLVATGTPIPSADVPPFVEEWTDTRTRRAKARAAKQTRPEKPPDPQAQAKRVEKRASRIESGLEQLDA